MLIYNRSSAGLRTRIAKPWPLDTDVFTGLEFMAMDHVVAALMRVSLFAGLKPLQITEIARRAGRRAFRPREAITRAGESGDGAFLILSGDVGCRTRPGRWAPLKPVASGSLIGEMAMFIDHIYGETVVAQDWVDCLKLERATLRDQMCEDPDLAKRLACGIRDRLTRVASELQVIDRLLLASIERTSQAHRALLPPGPPAVAAAGLVQ